MAGKIRKIVEYVSGKGIGGETVRYVIIGAMTTLINVGLFKLLWGIIGIDATVSNVTSISVSILFAYVANKLVVFRRRSDSVGDLLQEFAKFVGSRLFTMAFEIGALLLFFNLLGYDAFIVKIVVQVVVIVANYVISKAIVFRKTRSRG